MRYRYILAAAIVFLTGTAFAGSDDPQIVVVTSTEELVASMNPANAGKTIQVEEGTYCPAAPLHVPPRAQIVGSGVMEYEAGLPVGFREGTAAIIRPADGGVHCPAELGAFVGDAVLHMSDESSLRGISVDVDLQASTFSAFQGSTVMIQAKGSEVKRVRFIECDIQGRGGPGAFNGVPAGRNIFMVTGVLRPNLQTDVVPGTNLLVDPPGDPTIHTTIARSLIRANNSLGLFPIQYEARGHVNLTIQKSVLTEASIPLDGVGGISRAFVDNSIPSAPKTIVSVVEGAHTEIISIGNLYEGNGGVGSAGFYLTAGGTAPAPNSPGSDDNTLTVRSVHDRIENVNTGINARSGFRRTATGGKSFGNTLEVDLIGTTISTVDTAARGAMDLAFCPTQAPFNADVDSVGGGNWIYFSAVKSTGSGETENLYERTAENLDLFAAVCGRQTALGDNNGLELFGNLPLWERLNQNFEPPPPEHLFSF